MKKPNPIQVYELTEVHPDSSWAAKHIEGAIVRVKNLQVLAPPRGLPDFWSGFVGFESIHPLTPDDSLLNDVVFIHGFKLEKLSLELQRCFPFADSRLRSTHED